MLGSRSGLWVSIMTRVLAPVAVIAHGVLIVLLLNMAATGELFRLSMMGFVVMAIDVVAIVACCATLIDYVRHRAWWWIWLVLVAAVQAIVLVNLAQVIGETWALPYNAGFVVPVVGLNLLIAGPLTYLWLHALNVERRYDKALGKKRG